MVSTRGPRGKLFEAAVDEGQQHPSFREMVVGDARVGARALMQQTFEQWDSPDRQFVRDFQTEGFDARVFELYLAATLDSLGWTVGAETDRPDFHCRGKGLEFYIEAGTAHSPGNPNPPTSPNEYQVEFQSATDNFDEVAVRFGSLLRSKAMKAYQELPHVAGKPIVIAVQGFFGAGALYHTVHPLIRYLYDLALIETDESGAISPTDASVGYHRGDTKTIKSGWFYDPEAVHISAVMWTNCGTVPKFYRMAAGLGLGAPGWEIHRFGTELDPRPGATKPALFVERAEPGSESWEEGLVVMHNPRANIPLPMAAFEGVTQIRLADDGLSFDLPGRQIFNQSSVPHPVEHRAIVLQQIHDYLSLAAEFA